MNCNNFDNCNALDCNNIDTTMSYDVSTNGGTIHSEDPLTINYGMSHDDDSEISENNRTVYSDLEDIDMKRGVVQPAQFSEMEQEMVYEERSKHGDIDHTESVDYDDNDIRSSKGSKNTFRSLKRKSLLTIFYGIISFISVILIIHFSIDLSKSKKTVAGVSESQANEQATNIEVASDPTTPPKVEVPVIPSVSDFDVDLEGNEVVNTFAPSDEGTNEGTGLFNPTGTVAPTNFWWQNNDEDGFNDAFFNETSSPSRGIPWWAQRTWAPTVWSSTNTLEPVEEIDGTDPFQGVQTEAAQVEETPAPTDVIDEEEQQEVTEEQTQVEETPAPTDAINEEEQQEVTEEQTQVEETPAPTDAINEEEQQEVTEEQTQEQETEPVTLTTTLAPTEENTREQQQDGVAVEQQSEREPVSEREPASEREPVSEREPDPEQDQELDEETNQPSWWMGRTFAPTTWSDSTTFVPKEETEVPIPDEEQENEEVQEQEEQPEQQDQDPVEPEQESELEEEEDISVAEARSDFTL